MYNPERHSLFSDYKAVAPDSSFIHVDKFKSVQALARHLETVASNETLFRVTLNWMIEYTMSTKSTSHFGIPDI